MEGRGQDAPERACEESALLRDDGEARPQFRQGEAEGGGSDA